MNKNFILSVVLVIAIIGILYLITNSLNYTGNVITGNIINNPSDTGYWKFQANVDWNSPKAIFTNIKTDKNYLEVTDILTPAKYLWIANSGEGSISKVNSITGREEARYWTGPSSVGNYHPEIYETGTYHAYLNPSRTSVDANGDVWVANRGDGTVYLNYPNNPVNWGKNAIKIAEYNSGHCVDKNGNGSIETSNDTNGDGRIQLNEMKKWGQDECVIVNTTRLGNEVPRAVAVDLNGYVWVGIQDDEEYVKLDPNNGAILQTIPTPGHHPYGAVMDKNGFLWSSSKWQIETKGYAKINTNTNEVVKYPSSAYYFDLSGASLPYGIAVDKQGLIWSGIYDSGCYKVILAALNSDGSLNKTYLSPTLLPRFSNGVAIDNASNVWVVSRVYSTVFKFNSTYPVSGTSRPIIDCDNAVTNAALMCSIDLGSSDPIGIIPDSQGYMWVVDYGKDQIIKLNQNCENVGTVPVGNAPYSYSDASGSLLIEALRQGTWEINLRNSMTDRCVGDDFSNKISWTSSNLLAGGAIKVEIKNSTATGFTEVNLGGTFKYHNNFTVKVTITKNSVGSSPRVNTLTIDEVSCLTGSLNQLPVAIISKPNNNGVYNVKENIEFNSSSSYDPDGSIASYLWDFGDGQTSNKKNVTHNYTSDGSKYIKLTVVDNQGASNYTNVTITIEQPSFGINIVPIINILNNTSFYEQTNVLFNGNMSYVYSCNNAQCTSKTCLAGICDGSIGAGNMGYKWLVEGLTDNNAFFTASNLGFGEKHASLNVSYNSSSEKVYVTFFITGCDSRTTFYADNGTSSFSTEDSIWCGGMDGTANCCPGGTHCSITEPGCVQDSIQPGDDCPSGTGEGEFCEDVDGEETNLVCCNNKCIGIGSCSDYTSSTCCLLDPKEIVNEETITSAIYKECSWNGGAEIGKKCYMNSICSICKANSTIIRLEDNPSRGLTTIIYDVVSWDHISTWDSISDDEKKEAGCLSDSWIITKKGIELGFIGLAGLIIAVFLLIIFYYKRR